VTRGTCILLEVPNSYVLFITTVAHPEGSTLNIIGSWSSPVYLQSSQHTFLRFTLISSFHFFIGNPSDRFPKGFLTKILYTCIKLRSSSLCNILNYTHSYLLSTFLINKVVFETNEHESQWDVQYSEVHTFLSAVRAKTFSYVYLLVGYFVSGDGLH